MSSSFRPNFASSSPSYSGGRGSGGRGGGGRYHSINTPNAQHVSNPQYTNNHMNDIKGSSKHGNGHGNGHCNGHGNGNGNGNGSIGIVAGEIPVLTLKNSLSQISFCDRECYNINSDRTKEAIINYVQNKHKIRIIDRQYVTLDSNKMRNISHNEHLVSTYSNGNPYLLLLTRIDETPCCIFIDRKCKEGYNYPKMHAVQYKFARQLFDQDTLFTGELIRDINREWQFLIADLLVYEGQSTRNKNILTRFEIINNILEKYYDPDSTQEICPIFCKRLFQYRDLSSVFDGFMPDLSYVCKGLVFYTLNNKFSNYCWIMPRDHQISVRRKHEYQHLGNSDGYVSGEHMNREQNINNQCIMPEIVPNTSSYSDPMSTDKNTALNSDLTNTIELPRFKIIKTGTPDIYHLFTADNQIDRVCVAFIPDLATSRWLYEYFRDNADRALNTIVECKYHTEFDKWVPVTICHPSVSAHEFCELPSELRDLAGSGNSTVESIEKIKSLSSNSEPNNILAALLYA